MMMQIKDIDGNIIQEDNITLHRNDTLIMQMSTDEFNVEELRCIFTNVKNAIEEKSPIIAIPQNISLKVLSIK